MRRINPELRPERKLPPLWIELEKKILAALGVQLTTAEHLAEKMRKHLKN